MLCVLTGVCFLRISIAILYSCTFVDFALKAQNDSKEQPAILVKKSLTTEFTATPGQLSRDSSFRAELQTFRRKICRLKKCTLVVEVPAVSISSICLACHRLSLSSSLSLLPAGGLVCFVCLCVLCTLARVVPLSCPCDTCLLLRLFISWPFLSHSNGP